ncbi:hypothetical protein Hanom_Chr05g00406521 [Helianthus anomalus]
MTKSHFYLVPSTHEAVMSYQNSVNMFPWHGSYGGWQVVACNPYCSHGGFVRLLSLSLMNRLNVAFEVGNCDLEGKMLAAKAIHRLGVANRVLGT